jgi:hypothetical protein
MLKKFVMGILAASILVVGGAGMASAMDNTNVVTTDTYTIYNWYYDGYHAPPPNNFTKEDVAWGVQVGDITAAQYQQIVGEPYPG